MEVNQDIWKPYVLTKLGGLSPSLVKDLLGQAAGGGEEAPEPGPEATDSRSDGGSGEADVDGADLGVADPPPSAQTGGSGCRMVDAPPRIAACLLLLGLLGARVCRAGPHRRGAP